MTNAVTRWQIISANPAKAAEFYCSLFGWQSSTDNLLNYRAIDTASEKGISGGIWPAPPGAPSFVQLFIEVPDCAASVAHATKLGASVLVPVQSLPDGDTMAILRDPDGMTFGVVQARD